MHRFLSFIAVYVRDFVTGFAGDSVFVVKHIGRTFRVAPVAGALGEAVAALLRLILRLLVAAVIAYLLASIVLVVLGYRTWTPTIVFVNQRLLVWWLAFFAVAFLISLRYPRSRAAGAYEHRERGFFARLGRGILGVFWRIGLAAAVSYPLTGVYLSLAYGIPADTMMRYIMSGELASLRLRQTYQDIFSEPYWTLTSVIALLLFWRWFRSRRR